MLLKQKGPVNQEAGFPNEDRQAEGQPSRLLD